MPVRQNSPGRQPTPHWLDPRQVAVRYLGSSALRGMMKNLSKSVLAWGGASLIAGCLASGCAFTTRASVATNGTQGNASSSFPAISGDGRTVVFQSGATNLLPPGVDTNGATDVFVRDLQQNTTSRVSVASGGAQAGGGSFPVISNDARFVAFESNASDLVAG